MPDYDFHQLSPYDLEILVRDLLQAHWQVTIESFKSGKDSGIDLRFASGANNILVQVKHLAKTGLAGLLRQVSAEALKVALLRPKRYVLVTSVPLSPANKDQIVGTVGSRFLQASDVIGRDDINNLLGQHPAIESRHYKLWLASRAVLDRVLHNAAVTRSEFKARQVYEEARRYVPSGAYPKALQMLKDERVVIIAGPPGVGKSTLANLLLYEHLEHGYQAVLIQRDIEEGQSLFQKGTPQVFYFDDFMGATFVGDRPGILMGANDRALLDFIYMVRANPNARLILTTREHVYTQALNRSERLRDSPLDDYRVFLRMPNYSFAQRARILYNHLYFSDLPGIYQDVLLAKQFYLTIIKHQKFNPRLIEWLSSFRRIRNVPADEYRKFIENLLKDPSEIWRHAYEQEITHAGRSMMLTIFSLNGKASASDLLQAFSKIHRERSERYLFEMRPEDFSSALREVAGAFVKPSGADSVEVIDPSVLDLLNAVVRNAPDNAVDILAGASAFAQVERVWLFAKADASRGLFQAIRREASRLVDAIRPLMIEDRQVDLGNGNVGYRGSTFEHRLAVILDMAVELAVASIVDLIELLFQRLLEEWQSARPNISGAVAIIRIMKRVQVLPRREIEDMRLTIEGAMLEEASTGCTSEELRELLDVVDFGEDFDGSVAVATREAFGSYQDGYFKYELDNCTSEEEFDELAEDLVLFGEQLKVEVTDLIKLVEKEKISFLESHDDDDSGSDDWDDRWREERANERSVSDMFSTLTGDRD